MKCEDCLSQIETGGRLARWRARRHVRVCARCAAEVKAWESFKAAMVDAEPLSEGMRATWLTVAIQDAPEIGAQTENQTGANRVKRIGSPEKPDPRISNQPNRRKLIIVAAAVCLVGCGLIVSYRNSNRQNDIPRMGHVVPIQATDSALQPVPSRSVSSDTNVTATQVIVISQALELEQLDAEIVETLQGIQQLQRQLERHEVSQRIDALLVQHSRW